MLWAVLLAGAAGWVLAGSGGADLRRLRAAPAVEPRPAAWWVRWAGLVLVVLAASTALSGLRGLAFGLVACLVGGTVGGLWTRHRRRARALETRREVVQAAETLAGLIRVGRVPASALQGATDTPVLAEARAEQALGGDVADALLRAARRPGAEGLADVGRAWRVAQLTGASLTQALDAVARALADDEEVASTVAAELAAPRATGRVMAVLPLIGLGLGYSLGGDPVRFLVSNPFGNLCLVGGVGLACAGVWWTELVAGRAGRS